MKNIRTILNNKLNKPYILINSAFAGIIIAIMIYSGIFSTKGNEHPVKCIHQQITGEKCQTCGISRGFSEVIRFHFKEAQNYNKNSLPVFIFFASQLILRIFLSIFYIKFLSAGKKIIISDAIVSVVLFLICFQNLIQDAFMNVP